MSTARRPLGTGPNTTTRTTTPTSTPRLLPVERADADEHQEHDHAPARGADGPVPGRRPLGSRGQ